MIKRLLFLSSFLLVLESRAQMLPPLLTVSEQPYQEISGTSANLENIVWDDMDWDVPVGFDFVYNGVDYNFVSFGGMFGYGGEIILGSQADAFVRQVFTLHGADLVDASYPDLTGTPTSEISYVTEGEAGSRIFKVQWKDVTFYPMGKGPSQARINFQLWLYEGTNVYEFRYGSVINPDDETGSELNGLLVGVGKDINLQNTSDFTEAEYYALIGDEDAPVLTTFSDFSELTTGSLLHPNPTEGRVYSFTQQQNTASVAESMTEDVLSVLSTLVKNNLQISYQGNQTTVLEIYSLSGSLVSSQRINNGVSNIDVSHLSGGYYVASVNSNAGRLTQKFFVR